MTEFLVEVRPGRELRYRSSLSFRLAIRSSEIPPEARIFHRARRTWLPITAHPEYRRIQSEQSAPNWLQPSLPADDDEGAISGKQSSLQRRVASGWAFLKAIARQRRIRPLSDTGPSTPLESASQPNVPRAARPEGHPSSAVTDSSDAQRRQWTFFS